MSPSISATSVEVPPMSRAQDPFAAGLPADLKGRAQPARGARQQQPHRMAGRQLGRQGGAVALHGVQPGLGQGLAQFVQVVADPGADVAVQPGRHAALVFADFRQDLGGAGDEQAFGQGILDLPLVAVVQEREQQVDGHRFRLEGFDLLAQFVQVRLGQFFKRLPVGRQAPAGLKAQFGRDGRVFRQGGQVVEFGARLAAQAQDVGEPAVGDVGAARALALQHGIGGDGGPVDQVEGLLRVDAEFLQAAQDRPGGESGSDGTLCTRQASPSSTVKSVKVPPVSTPMRIICPSRRPRC